MPDTALDALPVSAALTGAERVYVTQGILGAVGIDFRTTTQAIANLASGGVTTFNTRSGAVVLTTADVDGVLPADVVQTDVSNVFTVGPQTIQHNAGGYVADSLTAPNPSSGAGLPVTVSGSAASSGSGGAGGNVVLAPGAADGAGAKGYVQLPLFTAYNVCAARFGTFDTGFIGKSDGTALGGRVNGTNVYWVEAGNFAILSSIGLNWSTIPGGVGQQWGIIPTATVASLKVTN